MAKRNNTQRASQARNNRQTNSDQQQSSGSSQGPTENGIFNVGQIMDSFYKWQPGENDDEGRAIKNTTAADMVTSAFQTQLATGMAQTQSGISKDMMQHQQMLEREAAGEARQEEFAYNSQTMGQQFDLQNTYANAQYDRDVAMEAAKGSQRRDDLREQGNQNRLTGIVKGEQDRLNIGAQGAEDRQNIEKQQTAQGKREQANISAQGTEDRANITTQQTAQGEREVTNIREQGQADVTNIKTQQSAQGERERGNIGAQGSEDRANIRQQGDTDIKKMEKGDELTAKKSNRQSARARSLARSF